MKTFILSLLSFAGFVGTAALTTTAIHADEITWLADTTSQIDVTISGTMADGGSVSIYEGSPSGLWSLQYDFVLYGYGDDQNGNPMYQLNSSFASETYWTGQGFYQASWGAGFYLPLYGEEGEDGNSFLDGSAGEFWCSLAGVRVAQDSGDPSLLDYTVTFDAYGSALPDLPSFTPSFSSFASNLTPSQGVPDNGVPLGMLLALWGLLMGVYVIGLHRVGS